MAIAGIITAVLGSGGLGAVLSGVAAFYATKANKSASRAQQNSEQLRRNHGSSVADAVARIETKVGQIGVKVDAHDIEFKDMKTRITHIEEALTGVNDDLREERRARRQDFAHLEAEIEDTFQRKEKP